VKDAFGVSKAVKLPGGGWVRLRFRPRDTSVTAHYKGRQVGLIQDDGLGYKGTISYVSVEKPFRRKGVATALLRRGRKAGLALQHDDARSTMGDAWARSLGERLPKRWNPDGRP
jgi:GNAT superfamily N-acetyltransferase